MSKENRVIPRVNYFILIEVIVLIICACIAAYNLTNIYGINKLKTSPLSLNIVDYNDLSNMMIDIDADTILVISYTQNKSVHNREVAIKKYLSKYNLLDNVLYLDLTDVIDRDSYIKMINDSLGLKDENIIKKVPSFIYFKDGSVELVKSLTKDNIKNLIKEYELNK